jgi:hypothetical protein
MDPGFFGIHLKLDFIFCERPFKIVFISFQISITVLHVVNVAEYEWMNGSSGALAWKGSPVNDPVGSHHSRPVCIPCYGTMDISSHKIYLFPLT